MNIPENNDILHTKDFDFAPYKQARKEDGFSGKLLIATDRTDDTIQYIVKRDITSDACNEFMYHKVAALVGLSTPITKMFYVSPEDLRAKKFNYKSRYMAGIRYIPNAKSYNISEDDNSSKKHRDFGGFNALWSLLGEEDNAEFITNESGTLFKIDNAEAFAVSPLVIDILNMNPNNQDTKTLLNQFVYKPPLISKYEWLKSTHNVFVKSFSTTTVEGFVECITRFRDFDENLLDGAIEVLDYFYDIRLGEFYRQFIRTRKADCDKFLKSLEK